MPEPCSRGGEEFVLRVKGDSMVQAGILDGDYVVVRRQQTRATATSSSRSPAQDEVADEATVKRLFRENGRVRLQPENDALEPIYADHVQLLGKVVGVFRRGVSGGAFNRTLDQELLALERGASLECLVCGEFVLKHPAAVRCPECGSSLSSRGREARDAATIRLAGRVTAGLRARGKSGHRRAGRWGNPRRRKPTESGTERRPPPANRISGDAGGKGETVG